MAELDIRYSELYDKKYLEEWVPNEIRWYPVGEKLLGNFINNWIGFSRYKASLTAILNQEVCGIATLFLMPYKKVSHQCMFYMIVKKEMRKKGIGRSLLKNVLNLAGKYFLLESVYVEIFENCALEPLLQEFDFKKFLYQKNYVKEKGRYYSRSLYQKFL